MATIKSFEELASWQIARELTRKIYKDFKPIRDYSLRDQIQSASVSIMSNIAEGFERSGKAEKVQFLNIARASAAEVRSLAYVAEDTGMISRDAAESIRVKTLECGRLISGLINYLKKPDTKN